MENFHVIALVYTSSLLHILLIIGLSARTQNRTPDFNVTGLQRANYNDKSLTDYNVTDYNVIDHNVTDYNVIDHNVTDHNEVGNVSDFNVTDYSVTGFNVTDYNGSNYTVTDLSMNGSILAGFSCIVMLLLAGVSLIICKLVYKKKTGEQENREEFEIDENLDYDSDSDNIENLVPMDSYSYMDVGDYIGTGEQPSNSQSQAQVASGYYY